MMAEQQQQQPAPPGSASSSPAVDSGATGMLFQTASGRGVSVSADARRRAAAMMAEQQQQQQPAPPGSASSSPAVDSGALMSSVQRAASAVPTKRLDTRQGATQAAEGVAAQVASLKEAIKRATDEGQWGRLLPLTQQIQALEHDQREVFAVRQQAQSASSFSAPAQRESSGGSRLLTHAGSAAFIAVDSVAQSSACGEPTASGRPVFTTGRGRKATVSADSLRRARAVMDAEDNVPVQGAKRQAVSLHSASTARRTLHRIQPRTQGSDRAAAQPRPHTTPASLHSATRRVPVQAPPAADDSVLAQAVKSEVVSLHSASTARRAPLHRIQPRTQGSADAAAQPRPHTTSATLHSATSQVPVQAPPAANTPIKTGKSATHKMSRPAHRVQLAQEDAVAESRRRERREVCEDASRKQFLAEQTQRNRALLALRQRQLPAVGVWSKPLDKTDIASDMDSEPATPRPRKRRAFRGATNVFNSHCPATAVAHGRDEMLLAAACKD